MPVSVFYILIYLFKSTTVKKNILNSSGLIDDEPLRFRGEVYHGYHFNCTACGQELDSTAREVKSRPGLAANDMVRFHIARGISKTILNISCKTNRYEKASFVKGPSMI